MTDLLTQQASRHAVFVQRFAGHLANLFDPFLKQLQRELKILLAGSPTDTQSLRRINRIISEYRQISLIIYGKYNDDVLTKELRAFSLDEAKFQLVGLNTAVESGAVRLSLPSAAQVFASVLSNPLTFPDSNGVSLLNPFIKNWEAAQIKKVGDIIRTGFILGKTNQQISQEIAGKNGYLDKQNRKQIKTMVRTATTHTSFLT